MRTTLTTAAIALGILVSWASTQTTQPSALSTILIPDDVYTWEDWEADRQVIASVRNTSDVTVSGSIDSVHGPVTATFKVPKAYFDFRLKDVAERQSEVIANFLNKPTPSPDLDGDGDVDMDDFGILQRCHSGATVAWDRKCMGW